MVEGGGVAGAGNLAVITSSEFARSEIMLVTILTALLTSGFATGTALYLARNRMKREFQLQFQAETIVRKLLSHDDWALRSFTTIKHHIGGFADDQLRQLLVQAGAIRFIAQGKEMWGLYERTHHSLDGKEGFEKFLRPDAEDI